MNKEERRLKLVRARDKAYKTWSKNHYSNDEMIQADLTSILAGRYDDVDSLDLNLLKALIILLQLLITHTLPTP